MTWQIKHYGLDIKPMLNHYLRAILGPKHQGKQEKIFLFRQNWSEYENFIYLFLPKIFVHFSFDGSLVYLASLKTTTSWVFFSVFDNTITFTD